MIHPADETQAVPPVAEIISVSPEILVDQILSLPGRYFRNFTMLGRLSQRSNIYIRAAIDLPHFCLNSFPIHNQYRVGSDLHRSRPLS